MDKISVLFLHMLLRLPSITIAFGKHNIKTDQSALLAFKSHVLNPSDILTNNWTSKVSVCNWLGVTCSSRHQRVVALNISSAGLQGSVPPDMGNLSFLNSIDLSGNNFGGNLPQEMVRLRRLKYISLSFNDFSGGVPFWFGFLPNLQFLYLSNNSFTGTLPLSLFNASKLQVINIMFNRLQGNIPQEIGNLGNLKILNMQGNQLTGSLPLPIFNLSLLERIALSNNSFSGSLPMNICFKLSKLQRLYLAANQLSGKIHSRFNNCSELQILSLDFNNYLSGSIPREIGNLTKLNAMVLGRNKFEGEIPREVGGLRNLEVLQISMCALTGPIPVETGNLQKLKMFELTSNALSGQIPTSIFNISSLTYILLSGNSLSGSLPPSIDQRVSNLVGLYLARNKLSGVIHESISNLTKLAVLELGNNQFTGQIPTFFGNLRFLTILNLLGNSLTSDSSPELSFLASLTNCRSLRVLSISGNPLKGILPKAIGNFSNALEIFSTEACEIEGTIPNETGNLSSLVTLLLSYNYLVGSIPITLRGLSNIQGIQLQNNNLRGPIPIFFCNFRELNTLRLSGNRFSGQAPECFGNITSVRYLFLDSNGMSSTIPASLGSLKDLLYLDFHSNSLSGYIPEELGKLKAAISIDLSRNKLSGHIPTALGGLQNLINVSLAQNDLEGPIPETFGELISLELLNLSHNYLTGRIPLSLKSLTHLKYFNVSFNKLRGEIPKIGSFVNFTNESFMSNEALCGGPPQLKFPPCSIDSPKKSKVKKLRVAAYVLIPTALVTFAVIILLMFMKNRRKNRSPTQIDLASSIIRERVSYYELQQATNCFSESNLIAAGSYGSVYKAFLRDGAILAVKVFNLELEGAFKSFDTECQVLRNLRHRNLVKVISSCSNPEFKALVLEYMPNGSFEKWLYSHNYFLDFLQRLDIMIDVTCALDYLHNGYISPIVHCDLKPSNVLLDEDMIGHVGDFGISKLLAGHESMAQTKTLATIGYIAPEYGSEGIVSTSCDVYSFGIILMEVFSRKKPTDEMFVENWGLKDWIKDLLQNSPIDIVDHNLIISDDESSKRVVQGISNIMALALKCTEESSAERMDIKDALKELKKIKVHFLSK